MNPELTYEINHRASMKLALLAKEAGVPRFIFSSSCSNYGAGGQDWLDEDSAFNPITPYGRSKVMVEQDLAKLVDSDFSPTYLRSATAYGVSPRLRFDLVLNNLVAWAYTTGRVYLKSDGTPWRPIVHVEDMSRAFLAVLHAPRELVHDQAFNVGRPEENYRISELAEIVAGVVPNSRIEYAEGLAPTCAVTGWTAARSPAPCPITSPPGMPARARKSFYAAYQRVGLHLEEFEGPRYRRIHHIKELLRTGRLDEHLRWREPASLAL